MRILFVMATLLMASTCGATDKCSYADSIIAESATDTMNTWPSIYSGFKNYGRCDDGGIAEGFTEAVVHLLATEWNSLPKVSELAKKDPTFRIFFLNHINASADTDEINKINTLAQSQCPTHLRELCTAIQASTKQASNQ